MRFVKLIEEGEGIVQNTEELPDSWIDGEVASTHTIIKLQPFVEWATNCQSLLSQVVPRRSVHWTAVESISKLPNEPAQAEYLLAMLKGMKDDFERGLLQDIGLQIEAELAADYMGQAERLLAEGQSGKFDHVPAAVLAGAVLEKALRTLCDSQTPPVPTTTAKGEPKKMNVMIDDLKKAEVYNEMKAKQLRAWVAVRNHAAHGDFDQFTRGDVEQMIQGINTFLADHLG